MTNPFILSPRYRLDDQSPWLQGIDPSRHYWMMVNGDREIEVAIPGLAVLSIDEWKQNIVQFRSLEPNQQMAIDRAADSCLITCISSNCYAIEHQINGAAVWHLFDRESMESLLMTAHPDWQCAPQHLDLGRKLLNKTFAQPSVAGVF